MEYQITVLSGLKRRIAVHVPAHEVDEALKDARHAASGGESAGRRLEGTETSSSCDAIQRATEAVVEGSIATILEQGSFFPVGRIQYEGPLAQEGEPLDYALSLEILPDIPLPEHWESLSVEVEEPMVSPGMLRERLRRLRRAAGGRLEPVEERRLPRDGDVLELDVVGTYGGRPVPGMGAKGFWLRLGPEGAGGGVAALARRVRVGETAYGTVPCPPDYPDVSLRGKPVDMAVRLQSIRREELPEADQSFAVSLGFPNLRKLHERLFADCLARRMDECRKAAEAKLLEAVLSGMTFPVPESLLAAHRRTVEREMRDALGAQGYEGEELEHALEAMQERAWEAARGEARIQTFLMVLGYREGLAVSDADVAEAVRKLAGKEQAAEALRKTLERSGAIGEVRDRLLAEKALGVLYGKAQKTVVDGKGCPVEAPRPGGV